MLAPTLLLFTGLALAGDPPATPTAAPPAQTTSALLPLLRLADVDVRRRAHPDVPRSLPAGTHGGTVRLTVNEKGRPVDAIAQDCAPPEAAPYMEAGARRWRFKPHKPKGVALPFQLDVSFTYFRAQPGDPPKQKIPIDQVPTSRPSSSRS